MIIDARGIGCPRPVIMAEESLSKIGEGIVEVLVDNEASVNNLTKFATKNGFYSENSREDNCWRVKIVKGYPCEMPEAVGSQSTTRGSSEVNPPIPPLAKGGKGGFDAARITEEKGLLLIVASDVMGKDEALGKVLMKAFFETMKVYKEAPHTIFFLNAGVKLTTTNAETVNILKEIEGMGVEIYSCGTCLKHYNLETELKVGHRGTTNHIVEGIKDFKKTVWIG